MKVKEPLRDRSQRGIRECPLEPGAPVAAEVSEGEHGGESYLEVRVIDQRGQRGGAAGRGIGPADPPDDLGGSRPGSGDRRLEGRRERVEGRRPEGRNRIDEIGGRDGVPAQQVDQGIGLRCRSGPLPTRRYG